MGTMTRPPASHLAVGSLPVPTIRALHLKAFIASRAAIGFASMRLRKSLVVARE